MWRSKLKIGYQIGVKIASIIEPIDRVKHKIGITITTLAVPMIPLKK